jgi:hypothetical protein
MVLASGVASLVPRLPLVLRSEPKRSVAPNGAYALGHHHARRSTAAVVEPSSDGKSKCLGGPLRGLDAAHTHRCLVLLQSPEGDACGAAIVKGKFDLCNL